MKSKLMLFFSARAVVDYVKGKNTNYDIIFYYLFSIQTFFLASLPSGFHSPTKDGWVGYIVSVIFFLFFYTFFYLKFYSDSSAGFLREVIILSVVSRFTSFGFVGLLALFQILIFSIFKLSKLSNGSLVYYLLYYVAFSFRMIKCKKELIA